MTTETKHMPSEREIEAAFEEYRKLHFGVYAEYPIDAFTYFGAGYKAASQSRAQDQSERVRELEAAERDRDDLLKAAGFKPGPLVDDLTRKVVLDDVAGMRPAMLAARDEASQAKSDAWLWQMLMFDDEHSAKLGSLLPRIWKRAKDAEAALAEARKVIGAAQGHLLNALIDLQTSTPKQTTIGTIEGGIKITRDWLPRNPES